MNIGTFRMTFLLSGIFLFSVFVVSQSSWGCDDRDKWDCDHHDRWGYDHQYKHCRPPKIQIVYLDFEDKLISFTILGKHFDNGAPPLVTLGGTFDLTVNSYSENRIEAILPLTEKFEYGDYRLVVSTGHGSECKDKYRTDYDSKCKEKHCTDRGSKYKDKYCTDHNSECKDEYCTGRGSKCKDKYSLTISPEGPQGPQGPPGVSGYETNAQQFTFTLSPGFTSSTDPSIVPPISVPCRTSGKKLLGGGGGITSTHGIYDVVPKMIYNGPALPPSVGPAAPDAWTIIWFNQSEYKTVEVTVQVYAICADVSQ